MSQTLVKVRSSELRGKKSSGVGAPMSGLLPKQTKTDLIRSLPATLSPVQVVEEAKKRGVALTANLVSLVRGRDRRNPGPPRRRGRPRKGEVIVRSALKPTAVASKPGHLLRAHRDGPKSLTAKEKELAGILFDVGLDRAIELVHQLKRALDSV